MKKSTDEGESSATESLLEPLEETPKYVRTKAARSWGDLTQSTIALVAFSVSLAVMISGASLLIYIYIARSHAPPAAHFNKELYFDYTDSTAVATATFRDSPLLKEQPQRVFAPGQQLSVWLELEAAEPHGTVNTDIFQVLAQLLTADKRVAATASRPCVLTYWNPAIQWIRSVISAPLVVTGFWREHETLKVPLFSRYSDQIEKPFTDFRAVLRATHSGGHLPHLYSARVHVDLLLGPLGRILFWITEEILEKTEKHRILVAQTRPGPWVAVVAAAAGLAAMGGGGLAAAIFFVYWLSVGRSSHAPPHSPPESDADADSPSDVHSEGFLSPDSEPLPRSGFPSKNAEGDSKAGEFLMSPSSNKPSAPLLSPGLSYRGPPKQLEAG